MSINKNTWQHIRRSPYQTFAAVSIMTLTFLVTGLFVLLSLGSSVVLKYFEQKPQLTVFFADTKEEVEIASLEEKLKTNEKVASVKYISKDEALEIYRHQFASDPLLLEMVSSDILPASLEISAVKIEYLKDLAEVLSKEPEVEDIVYQQEVVDILIAWTNMIRTTGIALVIFLAVVTILTVVTVVSMKIALKSKEIQILQLVGGSNWYIRAPFLLEGIFYGVVGSIIGWAINVGILLYTSPFLTTLFTGIPLFPIPLMFYGLFFIGMTVCGAFLGMFASSLALMRYIR